MTLEHLEYIKGASYKTYCGLYATIDTIDWEGGIAYGRVRTPTGEDLKYTWDTVYPKHPKDSPRLHDLIRLIARPTEQAFQTTLTIEITSLAQAYALWHATNLPDSEIISCAERHGYHIPRQLQGEQFETYKTWKAIDDALRASGCLLPRDTSKKDHP